MAWSFSRYWATDTAPTSVKGSSPRSVAMSTPAAAGATLAVLVAARPVDGTETVTMTVTDDLGGTWSQASDGDGPILVGAGASTRFAIFARVGAGGVSEVTVTATTDGTGGAPYLLGHVVEFDGGPSGAAPVWQAVGAALPSALTWPPVEVTVPEGALVLAGTTLGITSRTVTHDLTTIRDDKGSGLQSIAVYSVADTAGDVGPTWTVAAGGTSSMNAVTAAIVGATGPQALLVDVGQDQTTYTGLPVTVTATASGGDGARTFSWTSSGAGTFDDDAASSTTYAPTGDGEHVLTCTVTDSSGPATDTLTVTATVIPTEDFTDATGWTTVTGAPDRITAITDSDDGTYIETGDDPTGEDLYLTLPSMSRPTGDLTVPLRLSAIGGAVEVEAVLTARDGGGSPVTITTDPITITGGVAAYAAVWTAAQLDGTTGWDQGHQIHLTATAE